MTNEIEQLPRLLARAVATLNDATTAAEVLEARVAAGLAYDAAKAAERLARVKGAHDTVIAAIHRVQADALVIEAQAQCRLADEYDAAQNRGEIATRQRNPGSVGHVPDENMPSTTAEIGLTRKQVHEARKVRDAERAKPGTVRATVDAAVDAGHSPTRAAVKQAVKGKGKPKRGEPRRGGGTRSTPEQDAAIAAAVNDHGVSMKQAAADAGIGSELAARFAVAREEGRNSVLDELRTSMSGKKKFDLALERAIKVEFDKLHRSFWAKVNANAQERLDEILLPKWCETIKECREYMNNYRKGVPGFTKTEFDKIIRCLHTDTLHGAMSSGDRAYYERLYNEAFGLFKSLKRYVVSEKEDPTEWPPELKTGAAMDAERERVREHNRARARARAQARSANGASVQRR